MSKPMTDFTVVVPHWEPRVTPVALAQATEEQLAALETTPSNRGIGAYTLVLAHDPQTLTYRTPLFNGIMYSEGGLSRDETELAATAASVLNKCIYCAAVHASRFNQITKTENVMSAIFDGTPEKTLTTRQRMIFEFATKLSATPSKASPEDAQSLIDSGLSKLEIFDVILSASIFGWANRLMHILGEPMDKP